MNKYSNSKIYKIYSDIGECVYIGSTILRLCARMSTHRTGYRKYIINSKNYCSSFKLFDMYGIDNCKIELIEKINCLDIDDVHKKENEYIRLYENTVNQNRPYITVDEKINYQKIYKIKNKKSLIDYHKLYYKKNNITIKKRTHLYIKENKNIIKKQLQLKHHQLKIKKLDLKFNSIVESFNKMQTIA